MFFLFFDEFQRDDLEIAQGDGYFSLGDGKLGELVFHEVAEVGAVIIGRDGYGHFRLAIMRVIESNDQPVIRFGFLDSRDHGIGAVDRHEGLALGH